MWWPCLGHKRVTLWPFLGKGAKGFSQKSEFWHWASLGTLIKVQEDFIRSTMFNLNKASIFMPHLGLLIHWVVKWKTGHSCRPLVFFFIYVCIVFCSLCTRQIYRRGLIRRDNIVSHVSSTYFCQDALYDIWCCSIEERKQGVDMLTHKRVMENTCTN